MTGDMRDVLERELRQHAAALRGLARDLVGASAADDVVQETALAALRSPPRTGGALGGWLAGIVRHVASRHRRTEARRIRREQAVARERVDDAANVDEGDTLRLLTDAVLALPQPYRAAVFARYLKDLEPAAIAAQTGEPVATIKTRLKRGLALLRERFDAHEKERGGDWRGALVGAFGLESAAIVTGAAGVFAMTAAMKWTFGGIAAAIAVASFALFADDAPWSTNAPPPGARERASPAVAAAPQEIGSERDAIPPASRDAVASANAAAKQLTIRGRCVDENGAPLAGLLVALRGTKIEGGMGKDFEREYGEWLAARGDRRLADQEASTDAGGRFAFASEPSPLALALWIDRDGVRHASTFGQIQKAEDRDLGDLVIPCGCLLRCRVVDERGRTVPTPVVNVVSDGGGARIGSGQWTLAAWTGRVSGAGEGAVTSLVVAGDYRCEVAWLTIVRGASFTVPPRVASWEHEIVVATPASDETIRGTAVDERGLPLAEVVVYGTAAHNRPAAARTDASGRFTLLRSGAEDADATLTASKDGFYFVAKPPRVKCGSDDVRLVLCDAVAIDVRAVDDATGEAVTDYTVRIWGAPGDPHTSRFGGVNDRASGRHEHGLARVAGLVPGRHLVIVDPHRRELWRSDVVPVEAVATRVNTIDVRLPRAADRQLRVVTSDGKPVAHAGIDVLDASAAGAGKPVTAATRARPIDECDGGDVAASRVLLQRVTADASGTAMLHGPAARPVVVRVTTQGKAPFCTAPLRLDEAEPFVATMPAGAKLLARITPPEFVAELAAARANDRRPGFRLRRGSGNDVELVPVKAESALQPGADGVVTIDGVAPGEWQLALEPWEETTGTTANGSESIRVAWPAIPVATVTLRDGETSEAAFDLSSWLPSTLTGVVRCNGQPLAGERIQLCVSRPRLGASKPGTWMLNARTDADGRFTYRGRSGTVRVLVHRGPPQRDRQGWPVLSQTTVELPPNANAVRDFDVVSCAFRLRLTNSDGAPVRDTGVLLVTGGGDRQLEFGRTDADGRVAGETEPGTYEVQLGTARARAGTVTIVPGAANELAIVAP